MEDLGSVSNLDVVLNAETCLRADDPNSKFPMSVHFGRQAQRSPRRKNGAGKETQWKL